MFVTTSGRSSATKALRTATYGGTIIYNDPVVSFGIFSHANFRAPLYSF
jgi:hypothetical protein